jgi:nucleoside 2-deoxyribosyltransferase
MSKVYIAGPMTGLPEWNFPAFLKAAAEWRAAGWEVLNPAEAFGGDTERPYREYVEHDIELLQSCDAIAMLRGWDSEGARGSVWEWAVARKLLGIPTFEADKPVAPR